MRRKGIFTSLAAVFMVLAFSAMAFAANQVVMKTTVPNIPKSSCYQAGTDTMEFDSQTIMVEGDVITYTLNNNVTLCKAINMFVTIATSANPGVIDLTGTFPVSTTAGTIVSVPVLPGANQWGFRVQGAVGSQIVTLTLNQVVTLTGAIVVPSGASMRFNGTALTDKLVVKLFDGKGVAGWATSGIQKYNATTTNYDTAIVAENNAICIDTLTQDYMGEYVQNTPNSVPGNVADKLNFSGDYTIAHVMSTQTFNLVTCKGATCGNIVLGAALQSPTCVAFDYDTIGTGTNGYCSNHTATLLPAPGYLPKFIIQTSQAFDLVPYTVTAQILVNGVAGEHGVYWSSTPPTYNDSALTLCGLPVAAKALGAAAYLRGDGVTVPVPIAPAAMTTCASVAAGAKAVSFTTAAAALFAPGDFFFELNLPPFVYNLAEVNSGDVVSVRVTLSKATCGAVTQDLCIGTFITPCPAAAAAGATQLCPYVPSLAAVDTFWAGISLANAGTTAGTVALTAYKKDGTTATFTTPSIPAGGMYVSLVGSIPWLGTTPAGVPAFITAAAPAGTIPVGSLQGFVMMSDGASVSTSPGNSMGYLCKP